MSQYFPQIRTLSTPLIPKQAIGQKVMVRPAAFGRVWNWQRAKWKTFVQTGGWVGKVCSCGQPVSHPAACQVHNFPRRFHKILVKQNINQNPADVCAYKRGLNHLKACNIIHPTPAPWSPTLSHTHTHSRNREGIPRSDEAQRFRFLKQHSKHPPTQRPLLMGLSSVFGSLGIVFCMCKLRESGGQWGKGQGQGLSSEEHACEDDRMGGWDGNNKPGWH